MKAKHPVQKKIPLPLRVPIVVLGRHRLHGHVGNVLQLAPFPHEPESCLDASVLTALGAIVGMLLGWGLASAVAAWTPVPARIPLWAVGAALGMAIVMGMLFGLLPAYRGSRLDPVVALGHE